MRVMARGVVDERRRSAAIQQESDFKLVESQSEGLPNMSEEANESELSKVDMLFDWELLATEGAATVLAPTKKNVETNID